MKQEKHSIPSFRFQAYHLPYWGPVAQAGTRKQHNGNGEQGLKPEADACVLDSSTANKFSSGSLAEQCGVQTTSWASQSLSDRSPTKNTLAFGFYITPHCDSQEEIHSPKHSKPKQQALDFRLPSSRPPNWGHKFLPLMLLLKEAFCSHNELEMAALKRDRVLSFHCVALFSLLQGQNQ